MKVFDRKFWDYKSPIMKSFANYPRPAASPLTPKCFYHLTMSTVLDKKAKKSSPATNILN